MKDKIFVGIQFLFFVIFFYADQIITIGFDKIQFGLVLTILGGIIVLLAVIQLNKSLSPFPTPVEDGVLVTSGLYSLIRHPIYLGILISFLGYSLWSGSMLRLLITLLIVILFNYKSEYEESKLLEKYSDYAEYKTRTSKIFPSLR